jgi:peptidoglycan/LPS O-acetylase OafA/YrhL
LKRNLALDGIRGYAAFVVIIFHAILYFDPPLIDRSRATPYHKITNFTDLINKLAVTLFNGELAVMIFFVLSGLVLFESLRKRFHNEDMVTTSITFIIKRIFRIHPALIFCLISYYLLMQILYFYWPQLFFDFTFRQLWENLLLYHITMHGASWTLQIEYLAVPYILFAFFIYRLFGPNSLLYLLLFPAVYLFLLFRYPSLIPLPKDMKMQIAYFIFGFLIPSPLSQKIFSYLKHRAWFLIIIPLLFLREFFPHSSIKGILLQAMLISLTLGMIYYGCSAPLNKHLENKFAAYLGKISYSYYLLNVIFLNIICKLFFVFLPAPSTHAVEYGLMSGLMIAIITLPFAHYSEKFIEQPFIKLGSRLCKHTASLITSIKSGRTNLEQA